MNKRIAIASAALVPLLMLTGCGKMDKNPDELIGGKLKAGDTSINETPDHSDQFEYPSKPSLGTFKEDLTTPEGAIQAYYTYLNYGDDYNACQVLAHSFTESLGGDNECKKSVKEYANGVLLTFPDNLDLSTAIRVSAETSGNTATGQSVLTIEGSNVVYYLQYELVKDEDKWSITNVVNPVSVPE